MNKFIISFVLLIIILSFTSCRSYKPPAQYNFNKSEIIKKSFDDVWAKIILWFGNNNTPIKTIEKASGLISTEFNLSAENIKQAMDCGSAASPYRYIDHSGNFNIIVEKISDTSTKVTINAFFNCFTGDMNTKTYEYERVGGKVTCNSTGYLEKELFNYLKQ
jgi:hypothetical protein